MQQYLTLALKQVALVFAVLLTYSLVTYTVGEGERAIITRLGDPIADVTKPGLHLKYPWDRVNLRDNRLFIYDAEPKEISTRDKQLVVVDLFAFLKIKDGIRFFQKVDNITAALQRVDTALYSQLRDVIGNTNFDDLIGKSRDKFMQEVAEKAAKELEEFGLELATALSSRTDFPQQNKASVYARMNAERNAIAMQYRSEGSAEKTRIEAETNREYAIITSEAKAEAEKIRGEGDATATRIFNEAFGRDPEFFRLYRGLQAAQTTLGKDAEARIILDGREPHLAPLFERKK